ncbi:uncharacterized protein C9orf50 homolog isoform X2 [Acomys russatus]|uniref:uncharacterized protein C9orf50 homolog isoform X2 n=1 Tax=Acomys russatus TaxID=60746 RepID=UPI0021E225CA|nr:uncharacterized protein C9orf50 homolog isoform X2 [Acomys russatus]
MFRRQLAAGTPRCPEGAAPRRSAPLLLPSLPTPDVRAGRGAVGSWWQDRESQRLPCLSPGTLRVAPRSRGSLHKLLLPPLLPTSAARRAGTETILPSAARDNSDALDALLRELLPSKFRDFLHNLRAKSAEPEAHREPAGGRREGEASLGSPNEDRPQLTGRSSCLFSFSFSSSSPLPAPSAPQYPKGASDHCLGSRCPSSSFLPGLWDQSLHWEDSFREKPTLGPPRGEFITAKKANPPSGEGSRPRRRYCPFRVRFADETLQDTALRYWERNRAVRQNIFPCEQTALPAVSVSERVLGSVGRWLDSLPVALRPRVQDTVAGSACWNCPRVSAQEPQLYFSEDATMSSRLPFISGATATPRPRGGLQTFLDTPNTVQQVGKLP